MRGELEANRVQKMERFAENFSISIEQLLERQNYQAAMLAIERQIMNGEQVSWLTLMHLPQQIRQLSPFILQEIGEHLWYEGKLLEAKEQMQQAVKGYAKLFMPEPLNISLCKLCQLELRTGNLAAAQLIIEQLKTELEQTQLSQKARAELAHCVASCGLQLAYLDSEDWERQIEGLLQLFYIAIDAYQLLDTLQEASIAIIELATVAGRGWSQQDWDKWYSQCMIWSMRDASILPYAEIVQLLSTYYKRSWNDVIEQYSNLVIPRNLPYWLSAVITKYALHSSCQSHMVAQQYEREVQIFIEQYHTDLVLQYDLLQSLIEGGRINHKGDDQLEQRFRYVASRLNRSSALQIELSSAKENVNAEHVFSSRDEAGGWKLYLFGGLRISNGQRERRQLSWKRRKARELLIYLALQPQYTAVREQIIDKLQLGESMDKANQQFYVIVHQLKRTLFSELGIEQGLIVKDGLIRLHEEMISYVDVEHYLTLIRVADQLWQFDRGLSYEMYEQAYLLYDQLLPELPYVEWLEQHREFITQKQISLLQKCILHAEERQDWQHAEIYLRSWLALKPFQEEAHAKLIELLILLDRTSEAKQVYAGWEKICHEELGTAPAFIPNY